MKKEVINIILTITILLLCASSVGIGYYIGVEQGTQEGTIAGANYVAYNLCEAEKTFSCEDGRVCGCFNIVGGDSSGETG